MNGCILRSLALFCRSLASTVLPQRDSFHRTGTNYISSVNLFCKSYYENCVFKKMKCLFCFLVRRKIFFQRILATLSEHHQPRLACFNLVCWERRDTPPLPRERFDRSDPWGPKSHLRIWKRRPWNSSVANIMIYSGE